MKYRKKPVVIDAWAVPDLLEAYGHSQLPAEVQEGFRDGLIEFEKDRVTVVTMEGLMTAGRDWMLVMGVEGEFYPCRRDVFDKTYERETS